MPIRTWLVAHDFSPCASAAARAAVADAIDGRTDTKIVLCHAFLVPPPPTAIEMSGFGEYANALAESATQRLQQEADVLLKEVGSLRRTHVASPVVEVETKLCSGTATEEILAVARELGVARMYLGTHGRTGAAHLFLGSIAERIARLATVPVVIVKEREG